LSWWNGGARWGGGCGDDGGGDGCCNDCGFAGGEEVRVMSDVSQAAVRRPPSPSPVRYGVPLYGRGGSDMQTRYAPTPPNCPSRLSQGNSGGTRGFAADTLQAARWARRGPLPAGPFGQDSLLGLVNQPRRKNLQERIAGGLREPRFSAGTFWVVKADSWKVWRKGVGAI
jgi:hypothetical protein